MDMRSWQEKGEALMCTGRVLLSLHHQKEKKDSTEGPCLWLLSKDALEEIIT